MPMSVSTPTTGGTHYTSPFVGAYGPTIHLKIDLSTLTEAEVDADGYLKPGVPFNASGDPVASTEVAYGVTVEATKLVITLPRTDITLAAETGDHFVTITTSGVINRDIAEDNLGRAYTADEIAGLTTVAGSRFQLTST
jgi:hypothetical protein